MIRVQRNRSLGLLAEMKLPGEAGLDFDIAPSEDASAPSRLIMTARFRPRGLFGLCYWYGVVPFHAFVFRGMLRGMKRAAEAMHAGEAARPTQPAGSGAEVGAPPGGSVAR